MTIRGWWPRRTENRLTKLSSEALFFDLDGTLTDPKVGITRCLQYALERLGEPVPRMSELLWCIGPPLYDSFEQLIGPERAQRGVDLYRERFAEVGLFENEPYPRIHDTLAVLRQQGHALYVASSKPRVFVQQIVQKFELSPFFEHCYGSELDGTRTDKSELLGFALADSGVNARCTTVIGDRSHDAIGAQNNGLKFIGVLYGYGSATEFKTAGANVWVETHEQLVSTLGHQTLDESVN